MSETTDFFMDTHKVEARLDKDGYGTVKLDGKPIATTYLKVESVAGQGRAQVTLGLVAEVDLKTDVSDGELKFRIQDVTIARGAHEPKVTP